MQSTKTMLRWLGLSLGRSCRTVLLLSALSVSLLILPSCSGINPLDVLGGGPNVAANVQAGKTNTQTLGATKIVNPQLTIKPDAEVGTIDQSQKEVSNYDTSPLTLLLLIIGWLAPSPSELGRMIRGLFKR